MKFSLILFATIVFLSFSCKRDSNPNDRKSKDYTAQISEALNYCKRKNLNTSFFFLLDFNTHSGLNRFHIVDFNSNRIKDSFLVSHGCGTKPWGKDGSKDNVITSNTPDSHLSSEGKYIIGERGYSNWGLHFKYLLHGQDATNSNALKRVIVLHSWDAISDTEIYPRGTAEGWGCPAVSNNSLKIIDNMIKSASNKKVLLWIIK